MEQPLSTPDAKNHNPDPIYLRDLITQAGISQREAARRLGIGERIMRAYLADSNKTTAQRAPYPVQYALEQLASRVIKT